MNWRIILNANAVSVVVPDLEITLHATSLSLIYSKTRTIEVDENVFPT